MSFKLIILCLVIILHQSELSKILGVFPVAAISHQVVFRTVMIELAKRGHEVTVITTDPAFPKGETPPNYNEIDIHDIAYGHWKEFFEKNGNINDQSKLLKLTLILITNAFEEQIKSPQVQHLIQDKNQKFDLLIMEALARPALVFSHVYNIPAISFSTLNGLWGIFDNVGAASHPYIYPESIHGRIYNLTLREKITELHLHITSNSLYEDNLPLEYEMIKRHFGPNVPDLEELVTNIEMVFINVYAIWDNNRPVPPNLIYLGGLHLKPPKELPQNLKSYLDSSVNGVIYVSFGTNVVTSMFPPDRLKIFTDVFSKLPYDVLFKWEKDDLPGRSDNVMLFKWLPQSDLLRHPKIKLFITQCGQQSTDEALMAGVPLVGIPIFGDQGFNAEQYTKFQIGLKLDMETVTEESLRMAIETVIEDKSYKENVMKLHNIISDQPQTSLERAVWWTEYLLRHGGVPHLKSPAAYMNWIKYYEIKFVIALVVFTSLILFAVIFLMRFLVSMIRNDIGKIKRN